MEHTYVCLERMYITVFFCFMFLVFLSWNRQNIIILTHEGWISWLKHVFWGGQNITWQSMRVWFWKCSSSAEVSDLEWHQIHISPIYEYKEIWRRLREIHHAIPKGLFSYHIYIYINEWTSIILHDWSVTIIIIMMSNWSLKDTISHTWSVFQESMCERFGVTW